MAKYRKKPVEIEAVQYLGEENYEEICDFVGMSLQMEYAETDQNILIPTLEGEIKADKRDFIIKGVQGEFYPCKPDIFERTYETVGNDSPQNSDTNLSAKDLERIQQAVKEAVFLAK